MPISNIQEEYGPQGTSRQWMIKRGVAVGNMTCDSKVVKLFVILIWRGQNQAFTILFGRIFSITMVVSCHTRNASLVNSRIPHHRVFSGRRGGAWTFNHKLLRPDVRGGAYSTSSLLSSPDPNHWFSVLDAHSSHTKIICLQCSQACFIFLEKIYTLDTVLSVKWEYSDSATARKYMPNILESLVES